MIGLVFKFSLLLSLAFLFLFIWPLCSEQHLKVKVIVARSCPTFRNPLDCSRAGSSVRGISQARILEWVALLSTRGPSQPKDRTHISCSGRQFFYPLSRRGSPKQHRAGPYWVWIKWTVFFMMIELTFEYVILFYCIEYLKYNKKQIYKRELLCVYVCVYR